MAQRKTPKRRVDGILLLDKPLEITSNRALQQVKRLYQAEKAGHTGSLDPMASGLLPLCFGEATKVSSFLLDSDKEYLVEGRIGQATDTADAAGSIIRESALPTLDEASQRQVINQFVGASEQIPPMYSALKHNGKRLHELARAGQEVERKPRPILIHRIDILECRPDYLKLTVRCSKGTYIRTLIEDIALAMGSCGHVLTLRRIGVSNFDGSRMVTMDQLTAIAEKGADALDDLLAPVDSALLNFAALEFPEEEAKRLLHGQKLSRRDRQDDTPGMVRMYGPDQVFIGIGELVDGVLKPRRLLVPL